MAIEEEVGAAFVVEDRATAQLRKIGEAFDLVAEGIGVASKAAAEFSEQRFGNVSRSIRGLADSVATLADAAGALPAAFESAMGRVVEETARARAAMREMMVEMREMNTIGSQFRLGGGGGFVGGPGGGGGGGGGGGRGGGGHLPTPNHLLHQGGMSAFMFSPGGMIAGMAGYEMLSKGGKYSLDVTNTMLAAGINDPNDPRNADARQAVEEMFNKATPGTIYDRQQVAHVGPSFMNIAGSGFKNPDGSVMSPEEKIQAGSGVFRPLMQFAESQQQQGLGNLDENVKAGVKYMHLLRDYNPEKLEKDLDELAAISRSTGTSARAIEAIEKYSVTVGTLAGANPHEIASLTGYLGQSGITGSTAGTGLSRVLLEGLKPDEKTGAPTRVGDHIRQDLMRALRGQGPEDHHNARGARQSAKDREMAERREMGLVDAKGKPTYIGADGNVDLMKEIKIVSDYSVKMDELGKHAEMATKILDVFKIQASRALEPFLGKENQANLESYLAFVKDTAEHRGSAKVQSEQAKEPIQQFEQSWKRTIDAMISISDKPLHDLGTAAEGAARSLEAIASFFDKHKDLASAVGDAAIGAIGGAAAGFVAGGPAGAAIGAVAGGIGGGMLGGRNVPSPHMPNLDEYGRSTDSLPHFDLTPPSHRPLSPTTESPYQGLISPMSYHPGGGGAQVHIDKIEFHGMSADPEQHAHELSAALVKILNRGQMNNLGSGGGHSQSTYTTGRGVPV